MGFTSALADIGASTCFMSLAFAKSLDVPTTSCRPRIIRLGMVLTILQVKPSKVVPFWEIVNSKYSRAPYIGETVRIVRRNGASPR